MAETRAEHSNHLLWKTAVGKEDGRIEEEAADLMYHLLVLLYDAGSNLNEVIKVLENRAEI